MFSSNHLKTPHFAKTLILLLSSLTILTLPLISCGDGETADSANNGSSNINRSQSTGADENQGSGEDSGAKVASAGTIFFNQVKIIPSERNIDVTTWAISPDGGEPRRIPNNTGIMPLRGQSYPYLTFSPDCTQVAYIANKNNQNDMNGRLTLMEMDGGNQTQLSNLSAQNLVWSPDGTRIAYVEASDLIPISKPGEGTSERAPSVLHVVSATGEELQALPLPQPPLSISWSPDGQRFAFAMNDLQKHFVDLYTMNVDGTDMVNITEGMRPKNEQDYFTPETRAKADAGQLLMSEPGFPEWSHDSQRLAYISEEANSASIWVVDLQGLVHKRIWQSGRVNGAFSAESIAWSPDDSRIVLSAASDNMDPAAPRTEKKKLWLVAADGTSHRLLFEGPDENLVMDWCECQKIPDEIGTDT